MEILLLYKYYSVCLSVVSMRTFVRLVFGSGIIKIWFTLTTGNNRIFRHKLHYSHNYISGPPLFSTPRYLVPRGTLKVCRYRVSRQNNPSHLPTTPFPHRLQPGRQVYSGLTLCMFETSRRYLQDQLLFFLANARAAFSLCVFLSVSCYTREICTERMKYSLISFSKIARDQRPSLEYVTKNMRNT